MTWQHALGSFCIFFGIFGVCFVHVAEEHKSMPQMIGEALATLFIWIILLLLLLGVPAVGLYLLLT